MSFDGGRFDGHRLVSKECPPVVLLDLVTGFIEDWPAAATIDEVSARFAPYARVSDTPADQGPPPVVYRPSLFGTANE